MAVVCKKCYWCAEHVGSINLWVNFGLLIIKLIGGVLGRSQALIADALHSVSDIIIALLLMLGLKVSGAPPDKDHHWGHGNIEFIVSAIIGGLLLFTAITIIVTALISIFEGAMSQPSILAVWAAAIAVVANEILSRHSLCIGKQMASPAMLANAWENKADVYSSFAALIGVFGANLGFAFLDPTAAIVVGFMIARRIQVVFVLSPPNSPTGGPTIRTCRRSRQPCRRPACSPASRFLPGRRFPACSRYCLSSAISWDDCNCLSCISGRTLR